MSIIDLDGVSKRYRFDASGAGRRLRTMLENERVTHWALQDVNLRVRQGEALGVIGGNGSGKSTLLRIIAGLTQPTLGTVSVTGRLNALLTLGGILQPLLSARENALTGAILAGLTHRQAVEQLPRIAAFSELADEMDQPLRTFSEGMKLRLAFAITAAIDAEILLIDELLAVGDLRFREKCLQHLHDYAEAGHTVVLTSHEPGLLGRLCERTLWLQNGEVRMLGETDNVLERYANSMLEAVPVPELLASGGARIGTGEVEIRDTRLLGPDRKPVGSVRSGSPVTIEIDFVVRDALPDCVVAVHIHSATSGANVLNISTQGDGLTVGRLPPRGTVRLELERLDLAKGTYFLDVGVYEANWDRPHALLWKALSFEVESLSSTGVLAPPRRWSVGS